MRLSGRRPEIFVLLLGAMAAWALILERPTMANWGALCVSPAQGEWVRIKGSLSIAWQTGMLRDVAIDWVLMTCVMAPVLSLSMIRFVAVRSFAERRTRAVAGFLSGLLAVWTTAGIALAPMLVLSRSLGATNESTASFAFGLAALWQITPLKRSALQRCHRTAALSATGWRADMDGIAFGMRVGVSCVASCGAMMFACALASHWFVALALVQAIAIHERAVHAPQPVRYAFLLTGLAGFLALL